MKICDLVLGGSGVRLVAEIGALAALDEDGVSFRSILGSSGGAVVGALLAAGMPPSEMLLTVNAFNWSRFEDKDAFWRWPSGLCKGDYAYKTIRSLLDKYHVRTFYKFNGRLKIAASDITHGQLVIFGNDPEMEVAQAVRYSMSIPLFYRPLAYKGALMDDAGLYATYPINFFDNQPDAPTLGLKLYDAEDGLASTVYTGWRPLKRFYSLQKMRIAALVKSQDQRHVHDADWNDRTIQIDGCNIAGTQFQLSDLDKQRLYQSGYSAAKTFLATHPDFFNSSPIPG